MPNLYPTQSVTATPELPETKSTQVKFGKSWRFDFDKGDFVRTPTGKVAETTGLGAYIEWCKKALLTPRYRYLIYSRNYGNEFDDLTSRGLSREAIESEIKRMATEALMLDPRTATVENFVFEWQEDAVYFTCNITTAQGDRATVSSHAQGVV